MDKPLPLAPDSAAAAARAARDTLLAARLTAAAAGDADAFAAFYDATVGHARALARRIVHGADVDDTLAEAYLDAWRHAAAFDPARGSAVSWLLGIVHHRALDIWRRQHPSGGLAAAAEPAATADEPAERLWQCQSSQRLGRALAGLSASERWVLGLAYFRDLPHGAIARCTGLPLGTVKSLIHRAQGKLRLALADLP